MRKFELKLSNGIRISSSLKESDVLAIADADFQSYGNGYVMYSLPPIEFDDVDLIFGLTFLKAEQKYISLSLSNPELYGKGWSGFSETKEKLRAKHTGEWLLKNGYNAGTFSWGSIWVGFDAKAGTGQAIVRYS